MQRFYWCRFYKIWIDRHESGEIVLFIDFRINFVRSRTTSPAEVSTVNEIDVAFAKYKGALQGNLTIYAIDL